MGMRTPHADDLFCKPGFVHAQQRSRGLPPASDAGRPVEQLGRVCALDNMYTGVSPSRRLREYWIFSGFLASDLAVRGAGWRSWLSSVSRQEFAG